MSHLGCKSLSPEAKVCVKRVVEEELLNMQVCFIQVRQGFKTDLVCKCKSTGHRLQVQILSRFLYYKYEAMQCGTFATQHRSILSQMDGFMAIGITREKNTLSLELFVRSWLLQKHGGVTLRLSQKRGISSTCSCNGLFPK